MRPAKKQKTEAPRCATVWEATDAALWEPNALVGKQLRVLWPGENRYFAGTVVKYFPDTCEHEVHYEDGDEERLVLAAEKVQLLPACVRTLPPPAPAQLSTLAKRLDDLATALESRALQQRTGRGRATLKEEDRQKLEMYRRRAGEVRVAKERRELMLRLERQQQQQQEPQPLNRTSSDAAPASSTPLGKQLGQQRTGGGGPTVIPLGAKAAAGSGRPSRAAAASAVAAIAAISQGRRCGDAVELGMGLAAAAEDEVTSSPEVPFRVCSPGSAKRRRQFLQQLGLKQQQQQQQQQQQGKSKGKRAGTGRKASAHSGDAMDLDGSEGLDLDSVAAELLQGGHPWAGAWAGGQRKGAGVDVGPLYVPRSWPTVPVSVRTVSTAPAVGTAACVTGVVQPDNAAVMDAGAKQQEGAATSGEGGAASAAAAQEGAAARAAAPGETADGGVKAVDEDRRRASAVADELRAAYRHFRENCGSFKQYHELQVALWLAPEQLVGRELRILWPDEEAWFCGRVTKYVPEQGTHTVEYDDGDVEHLHLAAEEVRLQVVPGEAERGLAPQSSAALRRMAELMEAGVVRVRRRAAELRAGGVQVAGKAAGPEGDDEQQQPAQQEPEDPEELEMKADRWSKRATQLHALVAAITKEEAEAAKATAATDATAGAAASAAPAAIVTAVTAAVAVTAAQAAAVQEPHTASANDAQVVETKAGGRGGRRGKPRGGQQQQPDAQTQPKPKANSKPGPQPQEAADDGMDKRAQKCTRETRSQASASALASKMQGQAHGRSSARNAAAVSVLADGDTEMPEADEPAPVSGVAVSGVERAAAPEAVPIPEGESSEVAADAVTVLGTADKTAEPGGTTVPAEASLQQDNWATVQVLRPGEVVWAQVRRSAPWPAIVITREEAEREGLAGGSRMGHNHQVFVRFFGDYTVFALPAISAGARIPERGAVLPFLAGLQLGWHMRRDKAAGDKGDKSGVGAGAGGGVTTSAQAQRFLRALFELRTYMTEGELPRGMIPPNYDEEDDEEDDGEEVANAAGGGRHSAAARGRAAAGGTALDPLAAGALRLPLAVGPKLRILALGEVVWLSRHFHDEKCIYPLGYKAERMMSSGASGGKEVMHMMEVISEDGVRPLFRITPEGKRSVTADTASKAMRALFEEDARASGRAFARTGVDLYGLSNSRVAALVRSLPGAERCERFANWPADMEKSPPPPLTPYEEAQRRALYARALRLPEGVVSVRHTKAGMCFECEVCGEDEESSDDLKLECDMCRCVVHMRCYGVVTPPPAGALWLCDVCQMHAAGLPKELSPPCELCPVLGGARKRAESGGYVHLLCALWTPGVTFGNVHTLEPVEGVAKAVQSRASLRCSLCSQPHGACIQCAGDRCYTAFHPMCAREAGMALCELQQGKRDAGAKGQVNASAASASAEPTGTGAAAAPGGIQRRSREPEGGEGAEVDGPHGKENQPQSGINGKTRNAGLEAAAAAGPTVAQGITLPLAAATAAIAVGPLQRHNRNRGRGSRHGSAYALAGITLGKGVTMACFCLRHEDLVLHRPEFKPSYPGGRFAERRAELTREQLRARRDALLAAEESAAAAAAASQAAQQQEPQPQPKPARHAVGTGRSMSFADWRSRGHRAPEAVAIAREKRTFVRQLPYLVTGRLQHSEEQVRELAPVSIEVLSARRQRPAAASAAAAATADGTASRPDRCLMLADSSHQEGGGSLGPDAGLTASVVPQLASADAAADRRTEAIRNGVQQGHLPWELLEAATAAGARSVAERYWAMRATVSDRLAAGKSAIHGWGAFAKVPHKRGDMLIEYAGELIRPIVSDVREKRSYNDLVGCGTYIFSLNSQQHIDATKAGNMAHLLNHSCDPNCYSRAITLTDPLTGVTTDHVIITAKRDLQPWEELTYDYRFNSERELPCNCGAATCRLLVNWPEDDRRGEDEEDDAAEEQGQGGHCGDEVEEQVEGERPGLGMGMVK